MDVPLKIFTLSNVKSNHPTEGWRKSSADFSSEGDRCKSKFVEEMLLRLLKRIAIVRVDRHFTVDEVVFAEKGDLLLLGARTLGGLNLTVDPRKKKLLAVGPLPAAASCACRF